MSIEEAEAQVNKYFSRKFSDFAQNYQVIVKPINSIDLNSNENIKALINSIYMLYLSHEKDSATRIYILVKQFAELLNDVERSKTLEKLFIGDERKISIPTLEITLQKYLNSQNYSVGKRVLNGKKVLTIGQLNEMLQDFKLKVMSVFFGLYHDNNVNVPFQLPNFNNMGGELPEL